MTHRFSTSLSHCILAGTGVYCLSAYASREFQYPVVSYGLIFANSVIGIFRYGNPKYGQKVDKPYRFTSFLQRIFVVPCIAAQMWMQSGLHPPELTYLHAGIPLLPLAVYISKQERRDIVEMIIAANLVSMGLVSYMGSKYYGITAAISFAVNYFLIKEEGDVLDSIPAVDLFNYGMCFAAYFSVKGLRGE